MPKTVVHFPSGRRTPSAAELARRIRELAAESSQVDWSVPHFRDRLAKRRLTMRQALDALRHGEPVGAPRLDEYGCWRVKLRKVSAGRPVSLVVALDEERVVVVTII
jgi:hypothetical protein